MKYLSLILFLFFSQYVYSQKSVYNIQLDSISGKRKIQFSNFSGKPILVCVIPTDTTVKSTILQINELKKIVKNDLIFVFIPLKSKKDLHIKKFGDYVKDLVKFQVHVSEEIDSWDESKQLNKWLSKSSENGKLNVNNVGPNHKFLINSKGFLKGTYKPFVTPTHPLLIQAIADSK